MGEQVLTKEQKGLKALEEFLEHELGDYGLKWSIEEEDENYWTVEITGHSGKNGNIARFKWDNEETWTHLRNDRKDTSWKLFVELGEDSWEHIEYFDYTVKYFWMQFLTDGWPK